MNKKLKILHYEGSVADAGLIARVLSKGGLDAEILLVNTKDKFAEALSGFSPDVVLSDHSLPEFNSLEILDILHKKGIKIPFILITDTEAGTFIIDIINKGADDYVLKDRPERLPVAIQNALKKIQLENERQAILDQLTQNEIKFRTLMENNLDAITLRNENFAVIYRNPSAIKILGWETEDKNGRSLMDTAHPDDMEMINAALQEVINNPAKPVNLNFRSRHKDGHYIWVEGMMMNMLHDKNIKAYVSNFRDVSERKKTEQKIIHLNRLYAFLSQINQIIVRVKDEQALFNEVCRIAIEEGKFKMAWMGMAETESKRIRLVASYGANEKEVEMLSYYTYDSNGPIEKVLTGMDYYLVEDIRKEPGITHADYMIERGCLSGISLALKKSGNIIGALTIYAAEIDFFKPEEIALLTESVRDISFALDVFENTRLKVMADEKLEESESNLQAIFENTSEGFILADVHGVIKAFNKKSKDITFQNLGMVLEVGGSIFTYVHESRKGIYSEALLKVLAGETVEYDYSYKRNNGETRWFCFTGKPVYQKNEITAICITTSDITERKLAEIELRKSEFRYRQIVETAQEGIITVDENQRITFVNQKFAEIVEYELVELIGKPIFDLMDEESVRQGKVNLEKRKNGISETVESKFISKTGKTIWTNIAATPVFSDDKKFRGTFAMISDITERKQIEENVRFKAKLLKTIGQAVVATNINNHVKYWNHAAEKIYGYTREEAIGKNFADVMPASQTREEAINIVEQVKLGNSWEGDFLVERKDGKQFHIFGTGLPIIEPDGTVSGIISVSSDITERKNAEELLMISKSNLSAIIENTDANIYSLDKDLKYITFNEQLEKSIKETYGLDIKPGDSVKKILQRLEPEEAKDWQRIYAKAFSGEIVKFEKIFIVNEVYNYISFSIYPVRDQYNVIGLVCYAIDITPQKESENELRKNERALAEAQHVAKYGNWNYDLLTKKIDWSQELYNVFGVDKDTFGISYDSFLLLLDKEDQELVLKNTLHTRKTAEPFDMNCDITTPAGDKRTIHVLGYAKRNEKGTVIRMYGTVQDVTERKKTEIELLQLNLQFRNLSQHIQTVRENERTSIAREVHDELGQQMTSLKMDISWINSNTSNQNPDIKERLNSMLEMTNEAIRTIRRIVIQLRPGILDDLGLVAAIEWQAKEFEKRNSIPCFFISSVDDDTFSKEINTAIFRIFQESLTNVVRHAKATKVNARLYEENKIVILEVTDNGLGITDERKNNKISFGLLGMKERASILQGTFDIYNLDGSGTMIQLKIPI